MFCRNNNARRVCHSSPANGVYCNHPKALLAIARHLPDPAGKETTTVLGGTNPARRTCSGRWRQGPKKRYRPRQKEAVLGACSGTRCSTKSTPYSTSVGSPCYLKRWTFVTSCHAPRAFPSLGSILYILQYFLHFDFSSSLSVTDFVEFCKPIR